MYDILIKGGRIVDGTGKPGYTADVGVVGDRIADIGELGSQSNRIIQADGCAVSPGFIDIHSHTDALILVNPTSESKLSQGVTTEVNGNCGFSAAPRGGRQQIDGDADILMQAGVNPDWHNIPQLLARLDSSEMAVNWATLVGHGSLRSYVMGYDDRKPSREELGEMCLLAAEAVESGAYGLSSGLIYPPGSFADTEELAAVARAVAPYGGIYATHMRNEDDQLVEAVEEAIEIGRRGGVGVQISHHKACGPENWGKVAATLNLIDQARGSGQDVWADQYPYTATSTGLATVLPQWSQDGGREAQLKKLADPEWRAKIREEMLLNPLDWDKVMINHVGSEKNRSYEGMRVLELARQLRKSPVEAVIDLLLEERGRVSMIQFVIGEQDVALVMKHPAVLIGSDAGARSLTGTMSGGRPHPRAYGTFTRVLGKYVREEKVLTLEEAVAKMTGRTAARLGLHGRGLLMRGNFADISVFDPVRVADTSTYEHPAALSTGVVAVLVNGEVVLEDGRVGAARPGRVLRRGIH